jgi:murein DD-endopeptidase MepM/ murein hydrolase activator NlpD
MIAEKSEEEPFWRWTIGAVLSSYATIYFSENGFLGALILLCTLAAPRLGLVGLAGLLISLAAATVLGFERRYIRNGHYLFNSLLVSLAVAYIGWSRQLPVSSICVLLVVASVLALLFTVALSGFLYHQMALPPLSLPFVVVQLGLVYLAFAFSTPIVGDRLFVAVPEPTGMPAWLGCFLRSFGAIVFLPHATLGLAILAGMLCYSRLAVLGAVVGYAAGMATLGCLPLFVGVVDPLYVAFNFLFCGMALGAVFFVPSWSSLLLAAFGSAACAVVAAAEIIFFRPLGFAPLALPFNFVILTLLYALRMRAAANFLHAASAGVRPEESFRHCRLNRARNPDAGIPAILCPFSGTRVVTQGVNGGITHLGAWRHALDFEVHDDGDRQFALSGNRLEDNLTFNTPVLSPGSGVVVKTVSNVEDRPIGSNNFHDNWGNLTVIQLDGGLHVKLCHLKRNSLLVSEGSRVKAGQLIGYCGNSGRSPVPHLHVQMQASPGVGATTIPFRLRHYVETRDGQRRYHSAGTPSERSRLKGASMNDGLAALFDNLAYRRYSYRIRSEEAETEDQIDCSVDTLGNYVFRSQTGAVLTACIADKMFHTLEYTGSSNSALFYLWLGLSRVPFIEDWGVHWTDFVDARPLLSPWAAEAATLVGPFSTYPLVRVSSCLEPAAHNNGDGQADFCAVCEIEQNIPPFAARFSIPARIRVAISRDRWVVNIHAESAGRIVTIEQMEA